MKRIENRGKSMRICRLKQERRAADLGGSILGLASERNKVYDLRCKKGKSSSEGILCIIRKKEMQVQF